MILNRMQRAFEEQGYSRKEARKLVKRAVAEHMAARKAVAAGYEV
jgi:hypothetical protein